jgi:signal transduction histidine kinase
MDFAFNSYSLILIYCGTVTLLVSYYISSRDKGAVRWFGLMMCANAIWSLGYGFELASDNLPQIKTFLNIEYIGISYLPLIWFLFCLKMCGKEKWYRRPLNLAAVLIIPTVTVLCVWTNDYHHFYYKSLSMDYSAKFPMVTIVPGAGYRIFLTYFYLLLATGSYFLLTKFRKADPVYKKQNYSILVAAFIPWLANFAYLLGFRPMGNLDITPFAFIITIFLIFIGIYRFQLFDILPVAREKVLELMQDAFVILDTKERIIDYNLAFNKYIRPSKKIIGREIKDLFPEQQQLLHYLSSKTPGKLELKVETTQGAFELEADIRYLSDDHLNKEISIIKFQDQTNLKQESLKIREQANELQKLNQLKDKIFSIIAHDLRAPLVNLSEVLKMISDDSITPDEFKQIAPTLSRDIIYTTDLLENMLHWSRSQLKGHGISPEYFNLRNLILNEISYHLPAASIKKIDIAHNVFPNVIVFADMLMMQIVVRNILNNAIKFSNIQGIIDISAVYHKSGFIYLPLHQR